MEFRWQGLRQVGKSSFTGQVGPLEAWPGTRDVAIPTGSLPPGSQWGGAAETGRAEHLAAAWPCLPCLAAPSCHRDRCRDQEAGRVVLGDLVGGSCQYFSCALSSWALPTALCGRLDRPPLFHKGASSRAQGW